MERKNSQGQILVEVGLVMLYLMVIFFVTLSGLSENKTKNRQNKYQFTKENKNGSLKKARSQK
ncbi:hypothetical protein D3C87_1791320 [compost metagenome]